MPSTPSARDEKKHWWLSKRKILEKKINEANALFATQQPSDVATALTHIDAALSLSPRNESALELKARSLLFLRKFNNVADFLQDYIPSFKLVTEEDSSSTSTSSSNSRERVQLLHSSNAEPREHPFWCFSVAELKKKVLSSLCKRHDREGHWRYIVLGHACCHLGMLEDAMVLLQTGRRLAAASFRRESLDLREDNFSAYHKRHVSFEFQSSSSTSTTASHTPSYTEPEIAANLLNQIKLLLRRRAAAIAALDADLPSESIRHFSKILDSRRGVPSSFASLCFIGRAAAYKAAGRIADAISDCNRALALDPASIPAMRARADLLENIGSLPDCLRDLDHLKLLYDAILRDRKLPGPIWRPQHGIRHRDIPEELKKLTGRIQEMRQRVGRGDGTRVDYYGLVGVKKGCSRSELERTHLLLSLKHRPDKAAGFIERLEFADEHRDVDVVRDEARMSALILYRLLQKGYSSIMSDVMDDESAERRRLKDAAAAAAVAAAAAAAAEKEKKEKEMELELEIKEAMQLKRLPERKPVETIPPSMFKGVFCRDLAVVGNLLSQVGFNQSMIPVKLEALSC